jgi:hypothetical protein
MTDQTKHICKLLKDICAGKEIRVVEERTVHEVGGGGEGPDSYTEQTVYWARLENGTIKIRKEESNDGYPDDYA